MAQPKTKAKEWQGAFTAFQTAYEQIMKNPKPMLLFVGVYTAATVLSMLIQDKTTVTEKGYISYTDILMLYFIVPLTIYSLAIADKKLLEVNDFLTIHLRKLLVLIATGILTALIIVGSALLLLVPLIWTVAWFALAVYPVVDKNLGPIEALKESKRLAREHKGKVWGVIGVSILLSIVAGIVSLIPYIGVAATAFVSVLTTATFASLYRWLQATVK